uniref:Quinoid dihydropteridine reductase a n=1 Tax=Sinocyclocheilus grahami TaxID=75366 RepID=A0A672KGZ7_SINGR
MLEQPTLVKLGLLLSSLAVGEAHKVLVYGGKGALGSACVQYFRAKNWVSCLNPKDCSYMCFRCIGYGMAKAAVHQLCQSLSAPNSGLPPGSAAVAMLPVTLDTPMNRKFMPDGDVSSWTPLEYISELFYKWTTGENRPPSGTLMQLVTADGKTEATPVL